MRTFLGYLPVQQTVLTPTISTDSADIPVIPSCSTDSSNIPGTPTISTDSSNILGTPAISKSLVQAGLRHSHQLGKVNMLSTHLQSKTSRAHRNRVVIYISCLFSI